MAQATCSIQPRFSYKTQGLTVRFDNRSTGAFEEATWQFSDGVTLFGNNPSHTFDQAGSYTFSLTLSNSTQNCTQSYEGKVYVFNTGSVSPITTTNQQETPQQLKTNADTPATITHLTNYPNPFTDFTTLSFELAQEGKVSIGLYDLSGRLVQSIANEHMNTGVQTFSIERQNLIAGTYIVKVETNQTSFSRKVMVL